MGGNPGHYCAFAHTTGPGQHDQHTTLMGEIAPVEGLNFNPQGGTLTHAEPAEGCGRADTHPIKQRLGFGNPKPGYRAQKPFNSQSAQHGICLRILRGVENLNKAILTSA
jgi:hypothetical protein